MGNELRLPCTQEKSKSSIQRFVPLCLLHHLSESMLIGNPVSLSRVVNVSGLLCVNQLQELSLFTLAFHTDHSRTLSLVNFLVAHPEPSVLQIWVLYALPNQVNQLASFLVCTWRQRVWVDELLQKTYGQFPQKGYFLVVWLPGQWETVRTPDVGLTIITGGFHYLHGAYGAM